MSGITSFSLNSELNCESTKKSTQPCSLYRKQGTFFPQLICEDYYQK